MVAWHSGLGVGGEDNVDDPETCGVMKPEQKHDQQHRAEASCGPHVVLEQLWSRGRAVSLCVCVEAEGEAGLPQTTETGTEPDLL